MDKLEVLEKEIAYLERMEGKLQDIPKTVDDIGKRLIILDKEYESLSRIVRFLKTKVISK